MPRSRHFRTSWLAALVFASIASCGSLDWQGCEPEVDKDIRVYAGEDHRAVVGEPVALFASIGSMLDEYDVEWRFLIRPEGSQTEIQDPTSHDTTFTPDVAGYYGLGVAVGDLEQENHWELAREDLPSSVDRATVNIAAFPP